MFSTLKIKAVKTAKLYKIKVSLRPAASPNKKPAKKSQPGLNWSFGEKTKFKINTTPKELKSPTEFLIKSGANLTKSNKSGNTYKRS